MKQAAKEFGEIVKNKVKNLNATLLAFTDFISGAAIGYADASSLGWGMDGWFAMIFWGCLSFGLSFSIPQMAASTAVTRKRFFDQNKRAPLSPLFNFGLLIFASQVVSIYGAHEVMALNTEETKGLYLWLFTIPGAFLDSLGTLAIGVLVPYTNGYLSYSKVFSGVSDASDVITDAKI